MNEQHYLRYLGDWHETGDPETDEEQAMRRTAEEDFDPLNPPILNLADKLGAFIADVRAVMRERGDVRRYRIDRSHAGVSLTLVSEGERGIATNVGFAQPERWSEPWPGAAAIREAIRYALRDAVAA